MEKYKPIIFATFGKCVDNQFSNLKINL